jgi:ABC-type uncharacterized transport system permease subunit
MPRPSLAVAWLASNAASLRTSLMDAAGLVGAVLAALVVFGLFVLARGAAPLQVLADMAGSALGSRRALGEILVQATPFVLAGLATAVPSRTGLFNVGGEGQLVSGAIGAMATANLLRGSGAKPAVVTLALMGAGGAAAGALWALGPAILRAAAGVSEVISTLLLNNVAFLVLAWLVHGPWKDRASLGLPQGRDLGQRDAPGDLEPARACRRVPGLAAALAVWAARFTAGGSPFEGPVTDQKGKVEVPPGQSPSYEVIEQMNYLARGVIGEIPG